MSRARETAEAVIGCGLLVLGLAGVLLLSCVVFAFVGLPG